MKNKYVLTNGCFGFVFLDSVFPKEMERKDRLLFISVFFFFFL